MKGYFRIYFNELPNYLTVFQYTEPVYSRKPDSLGKPIVVSETVRVEILSDRFVGESITIPNSWTTDFVRDRSGQFRKDILNYIIKEYKLTKQPTIYR